MKTFDEWQVKKDAESQWSSDADIRAEFRTFECFSAYRTAVAKGLVRERPKAGTGMIGKAEGLDIARQARATSSTSQLAHGRSQRPLAELLAERKGHV